MKLIIFDLDDTLFDTTGQLNGSYKNINSIHLFKGVRAALALPGTIKTLVTTGNTLIQRRKIDVLGIGSFLREIIVCNSAEDKKIVFEYLAEKYGNQVSEIIVVGNRIDNEIFYGNECGFTTVHIAHGKYKDLSPACPKQHADFTLSEFSQFPALLAEL